MSTERTALRAGSLEYKASQWNTGPSMMLLDTGSNDYLGRQNDWTPKEYTSQYLEAVTLHVKGDLADVTK